jgi:hypothetical protein
MLSYNYYLNNKNSCCKIGPIGPRGERGPTGINGIAVNTGATGGIGPTGYTGLQGIGGTAANTGSTGPTGSTGLIGPQGIQGIQGLTGPTGAQGIQGNQGIQGIQGIQGNQGIQGVQGNQGIQGVQGNPTTITGQFEQIVITPSTPNNPTYNVQFAQPDVRFWPGTNISVPWDGAFNGGTISCSRNLTSTTGDFVASGGNFRAKGVASGSGYYWDNIETGSASTMYLVWRSSDNKFVTRLGTSLLSHKENIVELDSNILLNKVLLMKPKSFTFKDKWVDKSDTESIYNLQTQPNYGLIVEDIKEIDPNLLYHKENRETNKFEPYMWKTEALIAHLIGSIKQLNTNNENLNSTIAQLNDRIKVLENK